MMQTNIKLYFFNELNKKAQEKAIREHTDFLIEVNTEDYYPSEGEVIDSIIINEYLFFKDGTLAHCITYDKTGITELNLYGDIKSTLGTFLVSFNLI